MLFSISFLKLLLGYGNRKGQQFYIENPSYKGENFADKWNTHPERATAFFKWLDTARKDLVDGRLLQYNKIEMGNI